MEEFGKITLRKAKGAVRKGSGTLRVNEGGIEITMGATTHRSFGIEDLSVTGKRSMRFTFVEGADTYECSFRAGSPSEARGLIEALALASEKPTALGGGDFIFPARTPRRRILRASLQVALTAVCIAGAIASSSGHFAYWLAFAIPLFYVVAAAWQRLRLSELDATTRVSVTDDELRLQMNAGPIVMPLASIRGVRAYRTALRIDYGEGEHVVVRGAGPWAGVLHDRIDRARAAPVVQVNVQTAAPLDWRPFQARLVRAGASVSAWRDALLPAHAGFRGGALPPELLLDIVAASTVPTEVRVGACIAALGSADGEAARVRVAELLERETSPNARLALEAVLAEDDEELERALRDETG